MAVPKEKERLSIYLYPETLEKVKELYRRDDCRTQSQFIEKALRFYRVIPLSKPTDQRRNSTSANIITPAS